MPSLRERLGLAPMPRSVAKRDSPEIQEKKLAEFLDHFSHTGLVTESCDKSGLDRRLLKRRRAEDPEFEEIYQEAKALGDEAIEDEAVYRATKGTREGIWHQGRRVGSLRKKSDLLLIFILKAKFPEKYRDQYTPPPQNPDDLDYDSPRERIASRIASIEQRQGRNPPLIEQE